MNLKNKMIGLQAKMTVVVTDLLQKKEGLTTVEYAVAGALVAAAVVVAFSTLGNQVGIVVNNITGAIG